MGRRHRRDRWTPAAVSALLLLTALSVAPIGGPTSQTSSSHSAVLVAPLSGALCVGRSLHGSYTGSLIVDGNVPHPTVANRTIAVSYYYSENYTPAHGSAVLSCTSDRSETITDGFGGFTLSLPIPSNSCDASGCATFTGPLDPAIFSVLNGTPAGYYVTSQVSGTTLTISYVQALSTVALSPSSRVTVSVLAPTTIRALPQAGDGSATPAVVTFDWRISGTGWSVLTGSGTANLTIYAQNQAGPGALSLWVNGTYNGTAAEAPEVTLFLDAASTTLSAGSVVPTMLDIGVPADFTLSGSGAVGYAYSATILPGLGMPNVSAPCEDTGLSGDLVDVTCSVSLVYNATGATQPSANLSNGHSVATWTFQPISVQPSLGVSITPSPLSAYVGSPAELSVDVVGHSGTAPFGPACLFSGNGKTVCDPASSGPFLFTVTYGSVGTFEGHATILDASGANVSVPFAADIVDRPMLNGLIASSDLLGAPGDTVSLTDEIVGGAFPASYWWNESSGGGTLFAGTLLGDGSLVYEFTPRNSGPTQLNLTVLDHLGTSVSDVLKLFVNGSGAVVLDPVGSPGPWSTVAGIPYGFDWQADTTDGFLDPTFSEVLSVTPLLPQGPAVPVWVNSSTRPLVPDNGTYTFQPSDWQDGVLEFTIDIGGVVPAVLHVTSAAEVSEVPTGYRNLTVTPDLSHERLTDPKVLDAGARSNNTLYRITDIWGDEVSDGGHVVVQTVFPGASVVDNDSPIRSIDGNSTVWVNFTALSSSNGTVYVLAPNNPAPLLTIRVPGVSGSTLPAWTYGLAIGLAALLIAAAFVVRRRRGPGPAPAGGPAPDRYEASEEELRRMAEGRAHVLARSDPDVGHTLDDLAEGLPGRPPTPEELTEWVASLVADGSLRTALGDDGRSRFFRTAAATPVPPLRVELDDAALEEALRRRSDEGDDAGPFEPK